MTVFPYDQFSKDYLKELLSPLGEVETSRNIAAEVREEVNQNLEPEDQDLIMRLSPLYEQRLAQATQEGIEQGIERGIGQGVRQGQRIFVENLLKAKFGELDEQLIAIIEPLLALPNTDSTALLLQLSNLSREELLARFN